MESMKKYLLLLLPICLLLGGIETVADQKKIGSDCTYNGMKLYGKIQFVDSFPDIKVKAVTAFPDLKVTMVDSFPNKCGEWQSVDSFPDLKVKMVDSFPDLTIQFVSSFPGLP
jgi:hypothetical protein